VKQERMTGTTSSPIPALQRDSGSDWRVPLQPRRRRIFYSVQWPICRQAFKSSATILRGATHISESTNSRSFEELVQWAYGTLPQEIRDLPDFPGIQIAEEPPEDVLQDVAKRKNWPKGAEMLGLYCGFHRTEPKHFRTRIAPDLIFVFRGPILRSTKGDLRAEVKQVVWHEVAHWLGHNEEEVKELGLSGSAMGAPDHLIEGEDSNSTLLQQLRDAPDDAENANEQELHCLKCYSADVTCRELKKRLANASSSLSNPITVHAKICTCNSCGYEWDDEDDL
jgi:predicted Zn-dependent protease with MMP-like domain